jgi:hypothetical protein
MRRSRIIVGRRFGSWWVGLSRVLPGCGAAGCIAGLVPLFVTCWVLAILGSWWYLTVPALVPVALWLRWEWRRA